MDDQSQSAQSAINNWPGGLGIFKHSKQAVMVNIWPIIILLVGSQFLSIFVGLLLPSGGIYEFVSQIISLVISSVAAVGTVLLYLAGIHNNRMPLGETLEKSKPYILQMIGLTILTSIIVIVSILLFIIPVFFIVPRIVLAQYFLVDKKLDMIEALKASWNSTKGQLGKVYGIIGVMLLIFLPALTIIGIPVSVYLYIMYGAAPAFLYLHLNQASASGATPSAPQDSPVATA